MTRTVLLVLITLLVGVAGGWLLRGEASADAPRGRALAIEPEQADAQGERGDDITARLDRLEGMLVEMRGEFSASNARRVAAAETPAEERVPTNEPKHDQPNVDPAVAKMEEELKSLGERMESLRDAVAEGSIAAKFPTREMIMQAPAEQNRQRISQILADPAEADRSMKWMSQEEVLTTLGRPYRVFKRGHWGYWIKDLPEKQRITIRYVDDYVAAVIVSNDWQDE